MASIRVSEFDTWRPGYALATVRILRAGTQVLADVFTDEAATTAAANPQTLLQWVDGDIHYGKFAVPLYVVEPYELLINNVDGTGIIRPPLTTLDEQDASNATVKVPDGSEDISLAERFGRRVDVEDYGAFIAVGGQGASSSTNTATLQAAINEVAASSGGEVYVPAGTFSIINITLPQGVVLVGKGKLATILQSIQAGNVATVTGEQAGLRRMTLDGVSQVAGSVGVYADNIDRIVFEDAKITRFLTAGKINGTTGCRWLQFDVVDCLNGILGHGDSNSGLGAAFEDNEWHGGSIEECATVGLELKNVDRDCRRMLLSGVRIADNTGTAVQVTGASDITLRNCHWSGNTVDLIVADAAVNIPNYQVAGIEVIEGSIKDGSISMSGTLKQVAFRRVVMQDLTVNIDSPTNRILVQDCREVSGVLIQGNTPSAWLRKQTFDRGASSGVTTGDAATKAWGLQLQPGQVGYFDAKVVARGRNTIDNAIYHISISAWRPHATLAYDAQTVNFTAGNTLTGQTSGATARIAADTDSGATGSLALQDVVGTFLDNEIIKDSGSGSATANGTQSFSDVALLGSPQAIRAAQETDASWDAAFAANGPEIQVNVTGAADKTVEWQVDVDAVLIG